MLTIDIKPGQKLQIGDTILVMESKSGQVARLVIDAPKSVIIKKLNGNSASMQLIAEQGLMTAAA